MRAKIINRHPDPDTRGAPGRAPRRAHMRSTKDRTDVRRIETESDDTEKYREISAQAGGCCRSRVPDRHILGVDSARTAAASAILEAA